MWIPLCLSFGSANRSVDTRLDLFALTYIRPDCPEGIVRWRKSHNDLEFFRCMRRGWTNHDG